MKILISVLLFFINLVSYSQTIKTYTYNYKDSLQIRYSYYFDSITNQEILHGSYLKIEKNHKYKETTECTYSHGLLNGKFKQTTKYLNNRYLGEDRKGTKKIVKSYLNGILHGNCSYNDQTRIKLRKPKSFLKQYTKAINIQFTCKFYHGTMVGKMKLRVPVGKTQGNLDKNGRWIGKWVLFNNSEYILDDGFVIEYVERNRDNEIISKGKLDEQTLALVQQMKGLTLEQLEEFCCQHNLILSICQGTMYYTDYFQLKNESFSITIEDFRRTGYLIFIDKE